MLQVKVVSGTTLWASDSKGTSDPYVITQLLGADGKEKAKSKSETRQKTLNAKWNHTCSFQASDLDEVRTVILVFSLSGCVRTAHAYNVGDPQLSVFDHRTQTHCRAIVGAEFAAACPR